MLSCARMVIVRFRAYGRRSVHLGAVVLAFFFAAGPARATAPEPNGLDCGFHQLYNLDFNGAQREFESWEKTNPQNAMGPVSEAAGILFSEFNRLGVLESQF